MSVRTDIVNLNVNVNGNKAQDELNKLRKKAADVKLEMEGLKKGTAEYIAKKNELSQITGEMSKLKKEIGLAALTQKELIRELNTLKALRGSVIPFSDEYKQLSKSIEQVEKRLYDVKNGVQGFSSFMSRIKDEVKQFGIMAAGYLGFQFITSQFQNLISGLAKVSDQFADIQKVTGLSADGVKKLNTELSKIDTRTSTTQLREMAVAAGKLGKSSADDILAFVRAADQISVALGDDLSGSTEEIMKKLGKITQVFKTEDIYGTEQGLLKVGSAINELSAASNAGADYMVDFSKRMAGVAPLAGISIQQILGLGATLDQFGQTAEVSSTALSKLFLKMASDSSQFAKYAGMETTDFKNLLEKDFLSAFIKVLDGVKKNSNGISELAESLGDLGLDGGRVVGVLGTLANNTETLRNQVLLANNAFEDGTSITNEFAIKNNNLAATLDKIGKEFNKLMTSRVLNNALEAAANATLKFITALKDLSGIAERNKFTLTALAIAIALLTKNIFLNAAAWALEKAAMVAEGVLAARRMATLLLAAAYNVLTGNLTRASAAWSLFTKSFVGGPIGIAIAAIVGLGIALDKLTSKTSLLSQIQQKANQSTIETTTKIDLLTKVAKDNTVSLDNRKKALSELIAIAPDYLQGLTLENLHTAEGTNLIKKYIAQLNEKAQAEARYNLMVDKMKEREEKRASIRKRLSGSGIDFSDDNIDAIANLRKSIIPDVYSDLADLNSEINQLQKSLENTAKKNVETIVNTGSEVTDATIKAAKDTIGARKQWLEGEIKTLNENYDKLGMHEKSAIKRNRDQKEKYEAELAKLNGTKTTKQKKEETDYDKLQKEAKAFFDRLLKLKQQAQIKGEEPEQREIDAVEAKYRELLEKAKQLYVDSLNDKKKYSEAEILIEQAKQIELNNIFQKYFKQRRDAAAEGEYDSAIASWREYINDKRELTAKDYADGKINQQQYNSEIAALNVQEKQNLVLIAKDYAGQVKKAATDLKKFQKDADKEVTDNAIAEMERRKEFRDREKLASAQAAVLSTRPGSDSRLEAQKKLLKTQHELDTQYLDKKSEQYKAAQKKLNADLNELEKQSNIERINQLAEFVGYFQEALQNLEQIVKNSEERKINSEKSANTKKKESYQKQLDSKLISQKQFDKKVAEADAQLDKKIKDIQREQARREKALNIFNAIVNTAVAVTKALASAGPPYNFIMAAAVGLAGALQIGAISSQPLPELGTGYWLKTGPKHKDARKGTNVLIERDEAVMSAAAMTDNNRYTISGTPAQITSALNSKNGGVSWQPGAVIQMAEWRRRPSPSINSDMPYIMAQGGLLRSMQSSNTAAALQDNGETNVLLGRLVNEISELRKDVNSQRDRLKAVVSIKEFREESDKYDTAKKVSGLGG